MSTINQLSSASSLSPGDLVPVYSTDNGDARKASLTLLTTFLKSQLAASNSFINQYAAPTATGFTITVNPVVNGNSVWLIMTPLAGYAAGTITLPEVSTCLNQQELLVNSTQAVTTLTVAGNGATV